MPLSEPAFENLLGRVHASQVRAGLDFRQVEELLDRLEVRGYSRREVVFSENRKNMTVRWQW